MHLLLFLKGLIVGLLISIPIGPMALICIRRTLTQGYLSGFITSLGIAIGDSIYASIAGFGVNFIIDQVKKHEHLFGVAGGVIAIIIGINLFVTKSEPNTKINLKPGSIVRNFYTSILLTLFNPITLLAFIALFSWIGAGPNINNYDTLLVVCGIFTGAITWFNLLTIFSYILKTHLTNSTISKLHKITGLIIILLGIIMMFKI